MTLYLSVVHETANYNNIFIIQYSRDFLPSNYVHQTDDYNCAKYELNIL